MNNRDRNFTQQKIKSRLEHLEKSVRQYLDDLDRADREPACVPEARVSQLKEKIAAIKAEMRKLTRIIATIKAWMGATHFLTKTLPKVKTEMSLHVLAYNLKRAMKILGTGPLIQAIRA